MSVLKKAIAFFDGKKTNIAGTALVVVGLLKTAGLIDEQVYEALLAIGGGLSVVFLRLGITKLGA